MKRQVQTFMTMRDEEAFSKAILEVAPMAVVIDGAIWQSRVPPIQQSVDLCGSRNVYLWDKNVYADLPCLERSDGKIEGPKTGFVIQFSRSCVEERTLMSGRLAVGLDQKQERYTEMLSFVDKVWRVIKALASPDVCCVKRDTREIINPNVKNYLVGPDASRLASAGEILLKDRSTVNYFVPK